jgi:L-malate glycosyltransferase
VAAAPVRVLHVFSSFVAGGAEVRAIRLMAAFGPALRHAVLSIDGRTSASEQLPHDVVVEVLSAAPRAGSVRTVQRLRRLLASQRPDLVLTYNWGAFDMLVAAASSGFRHLVHHEDGVGNDEVRRLKLRRVVARRLLLGRVAGVVVPSRRLERVGRARWRVPDTRLFRIPNGIDASAYVRADGNPPLRARLGIPAATPLVGTVAHLRAEKGLDRLLAAMAFLPAAHLLVIGEGPERSALTRLAASPALAGRVHLVGHQCDPQPWYQAMDVFALSSRTEQLPVALLEAMASWLPVVATDVGEIRDVLPEPQQELLVADEGDVVGALGQRLASLAGDERRRLLLGDRNRRRVEERFAFAPMREAYAAVYAGALAAAAAARWRSRDVAGGSSS